MTATTRLVPNFAFGLAETATDLIACGCGEELSAKELDAVISVFQVLKGLLSSVRETFETRLSHGVDPKELAIKYEQVLASVTPLKETLDRGIAKVRATYSAESADRIILHIEDLERERLSFQQFLIKAIEKAKAPRRPIDWDKVARNEAAYERGETKPFQRATGKLAE